MLKSKVLLNYNLIFSPILEIEEYTIPDDIESLDTFNILPISRIPLDERMDKIPLTNSVTKMYLLQEACFTVAVNDEWIDFPTPDKSWDSIEIKLVSLLIKVTIYDFSALILHR